MEAMGTHLSFEARSGPGWTPAWSKEGKNAASHLGLVIKNEGRF